MLIPEFLIIYPWAMNFSGYSRRGVSLISRIRGTPWEEIEDYSVTVKCKLMPKWTDLRCYTSTMYVAQ